VTERKLEASVMVKNRSSHIPLEVLCSCSEGLAVEPNSFSLQGTTSQPHQHELKIAFRPSGTGINEAKLHLALTGSTPYTKVIDVVAFVDPGWIETDLLKGPKRIDYLPLGSLYVVNGKPKDRSVTIKITNVSSASLTCLLFGQKRQVQPRHTQVVPFRFPLRDFVYNPDEPKFSYRAYIKGMTTPRVLKVIDIVGEFVVSTAVLAADSIAMGRFGRINNWQVENRSIVIVNKANIELVMSVSSQGQLLELPDEIMAAPNSEFQLPLKPVQSKFEDEGEKVVTVVFTNMYNPGNVLKCTVTFDIRHSFLQFGRVTRENYQRGSLILRKLNPMVEPEFAGHATSNAWMTVTNRRDVECAVEIVTEQLMEGITIEMVLRQAEVQITSLDLQPNETVEIRVKVLVSPAANEVLVPNRMVLFGRVYFKSDGAQTMTIDLSLLPPN
jgi:hypothetical protein